MEAHGRVSSNTSFKSVAVARRIRLMGLRHSNRRVYSKRLAHCVGFAGDDVQIGASRRIGLGAALLPIPHRSNRDAVASGEFPWDRPSARRMIFTCGVRFMHLRSAELKGRASGSARAAPST